MTTPARTRNRRGEGSRLREEILDAAVALLEETGDTGALTLRGVARRAGISAPSIYPHFADLPTLVDAVLIRSFDELRAAVADAVDGTQGPVSGLTAAGRAYVDFAWANRARYLMMFDADGYAVNAIDTFTLVQSLIAACADSGVGHSTDPRLDTWMVWAALHGVATLEKPARPEQRRLGTLDRPAMLDTMIARLARLSG